MQSLIPRFLRQLLDFKAIPDGKWLAKEDGNVVGMDAPESSGGLTHFEEVRNTSSPNGTVPVHALRAVGDETNIDVALVPKGTGALLTAVPDGTSAGGNKRGANAVDLVTNRSSASQVGSGQYSVAIGRQSTASGSGAVAISSSLASGSYSFAAVTGSATAKSAIAFGENAACSGMDGLAIGNNATVTGPQSQVIGYESQATSYQCFVTGRRARGDRYGQFAHNGWYFSTYGDNQFSRFVLLRTTTDATPTELLLATWATHRLTIPTGKVFSFIATITGVKSDGTDVAHYVRKGCIKNIGGTTSLVGPVETIGTDHEDNSSTDISITADDTNDALAITVTGIAAETWRWNAVVQGGEIINGI